MVVTLIFRGSLENPLTISTLEVSSGWCRVHEAVFRATGPGRGVGTLSEYLKAAESRGELRVPDPKLAADQFLELCRAGVFLRHVFGVERDTPPEALRRIAGEAVKTFLARYAA